MLRSHPSSLSDYRFVLQPHHIAPLSPFFLMQDVEFLPSDQDDVSEYRKRDEKIYLL